ncbi:TPA: EamA family transporter [Streptococcus pneumoniae]
MNQYQKKIVNGKIYSLLSGLIWGICGILGEYFFTHYQVSSGWITSMRLTLAGSLVLIWSAIQLKSQVLDIWRDKKNYLPFLAYAILGIFSVQYFFYLCVEYSNATTATILQFISPVFILFYNRLVYQLSFTLDIWSILICLIIAFFGTAFAFFISMKAVSLVSPLVVAVISASEPLSSALLSVLFLGLVVDWSLLLAIALIILPMIFLSIEEAKESR